MIPGSPRAIAPCVGLGWRPELAGGLLGAPAAVDLVEVIAEACYASAVRRREALALAEIWPVVPHGVKLSLGSASGIERERAQRLGRLARELRAPFLSEHVAFTRASGRDIGHLTQLPFTRLAAAVVARNVAAARRELPDVPLYLENAAWTLRWPDDELDEGSFYHEVVQRTGCKLLLDLGNVYANARNSGVAPLALLRSYPLSQVGMIHLAGGSVRDGFYIDTHAHALPPAVLELLGESLRHHGPVPIVLERDALFPPFAEILAEVEAARAVVAAAPSPLSPPAASPAVAPAASDASRWQALIAAQAELAELLVATPPPRAADQPFAAAAIERSRAVLRDKRIEDALPLLANLAAQGPALWPLAHEAVAGTPYLATHAAVADAFHIAARAAAVPALHADAQRDQLVLRSRYVLRRTGVAPRRGPFVGSAALPTGRLWAYKGVGSGAQVYLRLSPADPGAR
jgi:uncharacterized protein (UPF0276 family)